MKLGLVGANGSVGTELCFLLNEDTELKPIIRNRLGAVFLKHHGFNCHIADISQKNDAKENLSDVDLTVITSYTTDPFSGTIGTISSPFRSADFRSTSSLEKRQFLIFPSVVNLILLQVSQKGAVMELITANVPRKDFTR